MSKGSEGFVLVDSESSGEDDITQFVFTHRASRSHSRSSQDPRSDIVSSSIPVFAPSPDEPSGPPLSSFLARY